MAAASWRLIVAKHLALIVAIMARRHRQSGRTAQRAIGDAYDAVLFQLVRIAHNGSIISV